MLKTLKNYQILDLMDGFKKIAEDGIKSNKRFSYALIMNEENVQSNVKAIQGIAKPSDNYMEYEQKRNNILIEYGKSDASGNIILNENNGVVFKDEESEKNAIDEINKLNEEYLDILDERNEDIKQYNELLMTDVELNLIVVSLDDVPDEVGEDVFLMKALIPMID